MHGLVWGAAIGYMLADIHAETNGLLFLGTPRNKTGAATAFVLVCPAIGLVVGLLFDLSKRYDSHRIEFSNISIRLLGLCMLIYCVIMSFALLPQVH